MEKGNKRLIKHRQDNSHENQKREGIRTARLRNMEKSTNQSRYTTPKLDEIVERFLVGSSVRIPSIHARIGAETAVSERPSATIRSHCLLLHPSTLDSRSPPPQPLPQDTRKRITFLPASTAPRFFLYFPFPFALSRFSFTLRATTIST
jgi:hypothetical protein